MNIFVLDRNVRKCAQYHCDQHVSKMILESAQIMCTALHTMGFKTPYRSTHGTEFKYRYEKDKDHASIHVIREIENLKFSDKGLTEFAQAVPKRYKFRGNAVRAYRSFYRGEKAKFARWTKRPIPWWMNVTS
jgi:hypothetical protein